MKNLNTVLSTLLLTGLLNTGQAQTIHPDLSFGTNGSVTTDVSGNYDGATDMLVQPDGKFVVTGYSTPKSHKQFMVARYEPDGTPDLNFGNNGNATIPVGVVNNYAKAIALQQDGKIVVAGYFDNNFYNDAAVVRFNANGTADNSFGISGVAQFILSTGFDELHDIAIQGDGKIVVSGRTYNSVSNYNMLIMRLLPNGDPDSSFDQDGILQIDFNNYNDNATSLALLDGGKILVTGTTEYGSSYFAAAQCLDDGSPDSSFSTDGKVVLAAGLRLDKSYGMAIQTDNRVVMVGTHHDGQTDEYMIVRFLSSGVIDSTFGNYGESRIATTESRDILNDVIIQPDGRILIAGSGSGKQGLLMRLTDSGIPDSTFGTQGIFTGNMGGVETTLNSLIWLPDSTVIACGVTNPATNENVLLTKNLINLNTGIAGINGRDFEFEIYPMPMQQTATIELPFHSKKPVHVQLIDLTGRVLQEETILSDGFSFQFTNRTSIRPGVYVLTVNSEDKTSTKKVILN